ncbi:MAG: RidA family protein [Lachnospiraceae bacterium]|nr:RidA family protein [Lachnospiraceae bacterium]
MEKKIISTTKAPAAVGPYVQAIQAGNFLYASGQLGLIPETGTLPEGVEAQTVQALKNVEAILTEAGYTKEDVIKTSVFLDDINDFATINGIYADFFGEHRPARSCVEVAKLPKGGLIEIEIIAAK